MKWLALPALLLLSACSAGGGDTATDSTGDLDTVQFGPLSDKPVPFTLSGTIRYEDRLYGSKPESDTQVGFIGTSFQPVRHATVEVVNSSDQVLITTRSDEAGHYNLSLTAAGELRLRVLPQSASAAAVQVSVKKPGGALLAVSRGFIPGAGDWTLDADIPIERFAGAFNIYDALVSAGEFVQAQSGSYPGKVTAWWYPGSEQGTYFNGYGIYVLGGDGTGGGDTDEFDDDVLWHEYGHFLEHANGSLDSPGGYHYLEQTDQDLRLSWSEGWANFTSGAVKAWLATQGRAISDTSGVESLYVDTKGDDAMIAYTFDYDFSKDAQWDAVVRHATNEGAVAKVLWDLSQSFNTMDIWSVFGSAFGSTTRPAALEIYSDGWRSRLTAPQEPAFWTALNGRRIAYDLDSYEASGDDDSATTTALNPGTAQTHTLHSAAGDVDFFRLTPTANVEFSIETFGLTDGLDTMLFLYAEGDLTTHVASNDNHDGKLYTGTGAQHVHDGCKLASRLVHTPLSAGTYYLKVVAPSTLPQGAGRQGSYSILMSQPSAPAKCPAS